MSYPPEESFAEISARRYSRRSLLQAGLGGLAFALLPAVSFARKAKQATALAPLGFTEIDKATTTTHQVAPGYHLQVLLRWGDPIFADAPALDTQQPDASKQARQFGFNNDYIAFMPLPQGSQNSAHGLLCVNHEYTTIPNMYPALAGKALTVSQVQGLQAAQGVSIVEIMLVDSQWETVPEGIYNRRILPNTPVQFAGPAAGNARLKTGYDETGCSGFGTLANCAGGVTPWGTVLTCEENFNDYFPGNPAGMAEERNYTRMGIGKSKYPQPWWTQDARFDTAKEPNEPNRFGWVVEYDPYDQAMTPIKHTAMGRYKHESATIALSHDGRVASYSGDDEKFEYLYRYTSANVYQPGIAKADAAKLLDEGTLYAAKFSDDGTMQWLPLCYGTGPLTRENNFHSQADVLIETRLAAQLMGATPMDRPEDVEVHPATGKIYVALTKNADRAAVGANAANPRAHNRFGHVIELTPPRQDGKPVHTAERYRWDMFLRGGNPAKAEDAAMYLAPPSAAGYLACPDNLAIDPSGRLWIATDGQRDAIGFCDSLYAVELSGPNRGRPRLFLNGPAGCEITGPCFTPDGRTLFLSIQHPGEDGKPGAPTTRWPDFRDDTPPRPSVVAVRKADGGVVGE